MVRSSWKPSARSGPIFSPRLILANERTAITFNSAAAELRQQPQDLEVQPDQRDHQREGAVPLHVFRRAHPCAVLDEVEIKDEIQRRDDHHKQAEADPDWTRAVDGCEVHTEKPQDE